MALRPRLFRLPTLTSAGLAAALSLPLACKTESAAPSSAASGAPGATATATQPQTAERAPALGANPSGVVRVVSADAELLQRPTTAAFRGQRLWVSIGQLSALFEAGKTPRLPFSAISLDVAAGTPTPEKVELPGSDYYPEGIAAAGDGTLYIGSIMQGIVSKVAPGGTTATPFVTVGVSRRGVIGLTVDTPRGLLWICDSNPKLEEARKAGELVGVRLTDGTEKVRHVLPPLDGKAPFCNDVIVSPDGALWVTDSAGGRVFRIPATAALAAGTAEAWITGGEVGPPPTGGSGANGLEWVDGTLVVANVGRGTLVALDPSSTDPSRGAKVIALRDQQGAPVTLCSPDGVELVPGSKDSVVVVENGGCASKTARIAEVKLDLRH
jgi:sugar lactone lactonase YvrE